MLAMLTDMKMIPHSHFGMSGPIRSHTLVYTVVLASALAVFFDLSRIASLGAFFYLIMDVLLCAIAFDGFVLAAFTTMKLGSDPMIVLYAGAAISAVFIYERIYLKRWTALEAEAKH